MKALATNAARRNTGVGLWEIGHVFRRPAPGTATGPVPDEREMLGVALGGRDATVGIETWWAVAEAPHPRRHGRQPRGRGLHLDPLGRAGHRRRRNRRGSRRARPGVLDAHGIDERVRVARGSTSAALAELARDPHVYRAVSVYPSSDVDLAFEVDDTVPATEVETVIDRAAGERLGALRLFDVYRGHASPGRRSLAYSLRLHAPDHPSPTTRSPTCGAGASRPSRAPSRPRCVA